MWRRPVRRPLRSIPRQQRRRIFRRRATKTVKAERAAPPLPPAVVALAPLPERAARLLVPAGRLLGLVVVVLVPLLVRVARPLARAVRPPVPAGPRPVRPLVRAVLVRVPAFVLARVSAFVRLACVVRA
jgi:hypothetical protein